MAADPRHIFHIGPRAHRFSSGASRRFSTRHPSMRPERSQHPVVPRPSRRAFAVALLLALALAGTTSAADGSNSARADSRDVKAVFLVNFLSFAEWPAAKLGAPGARLTIATLGDPSFAAVVERAAAGHLV